MKKLITILILFTAVVGVSSSASAYNWWTNKAKLTGNVNAEQYYISHDYFDTRGYGIMIEEAVSQWNSSVNSSTTDSTNVAFTRQSTRAGSDVDFLIGNYGTTDWNGVTTFFIIGEGQISTTGFGPSRNYDYAEIMMNDSYLNDDSQTDIKSTAKHEFGHALGLAHSTNLNAIMYKDRSRTTDNVGSDDVYGVMFLY